MSHSDHVTKGFAEEMAKLARRIAKLIPMKKPMVTPPAAASAATRPVQRRGALANIALGAGVLGAGTVGATHIADKPIRRARWAEKVRTGPLGQQNLMMAPRSFG